MKALIQLVFLAMVGALCGCASGAKLVKELKGDPAIVSGQVTSLYGNVKFVRIGVQTNNAVQVSPDGTVTITPKLAQ